MKTRVIQDDPDEPTTQQDPVDPGAEPRRSTNLAGRMGRWSAQHRKIAIFGWLAFVVVAFALGIVSRHDADRAGHLRAWASPAVSTGFSMRASSSPRARSCSSRARRSTSRIRPSRRRSRMSSRGSRRSTSSRTSARRSTPENRGQIAPERTRGACRVRHPWRPRRRDDEDRSGRRRRRRRPEGASAALHRRVRRQRRQGARSRLHGRPQEGRASLAPGDAHHPHRRLRSARRGGHPAAARAHRDHRDVRTGRASELARADRRDRPTSSSS